MKMATQEPKKKLCGCTGVRSCLLCEDGRGGTSSSLEPASLFIQCSVCGQLLKKAAQEDEKSGRHESCTPSHLWNPVLSQGELKFDGVLVIQEFITPEEERGLVEAIDQQQWADSQSGRKKQVCASLTELFFLPERARWSSNTRGQQGKAQIPLWWGRGRVGLCETSLQSGITDP